MSAIIGLVGVHDRISLLCGLHETFHDLSPIDFHRGVYRISNYPESFFPPAFRDIRYFTRALVLGEENRTVIYNPSLVALLQYAVLPLRGFLNRIFRV